MAAFVYDIAVNGILNGTIDLATDTLKVMLVTAAYTPSKTDANVGVITSAEIVATNYVAGFGGAGRKPAARSIVNDTTANDNRVIFSGNITWISLGGATNATIAGAVLIKEITSDAGSIPIANWPLSSAITTTGSNFVLTVDAVNGNIIFTQ
jgi:hypothetical protein